MATEKTVIIVCGPTAIGKTGFAISLATALHTSIISFDSRQCYKELNIGVAKPSAEELAAIPHHFIHSHSITEEVNAAVFEKYALNISESIWQHHSVVVMVGGTGMYMKAFCEGLDNIPATDPAIREMIKEKYYRYGLEYLQQQLIEKDPDFWKQAEQQNPQRLMRALEVLLTTGNSILHYRSGHGVKRPFRILKIGLELPRSQLIHQINGRVEDMVDKGLFEEALALRDFKNLNALQTVGYAEIFDFSAGKISKEEAIAQIKTHTRQYAKRQITWFKKDNSIFWFHPNQMLDDILSKIGYIL